ncbi:WD repeat-containing protein 20 [Drosophila grimshawi]|uniref:GH14074 n=1 Tax=Drosophila grimshawi TaxID=7222 RepID=B4JY66_DROGR|nr:WD repeat-containing protein 20 [Drosophila grimshawi]EDV90628.1 GH14074 [Drosophila grimshawi]
MANQLDGNVKDDLKTQFVTREGTYRLLTLSEYSRPNRVGYSNNQSSPQVRVSFVTLPNPNKNNTNSDLATPATTTTTTSDKQSNGATTTTPATPTTAAAAATTTASATTSNGASGDSNYNGSSTVDARLGGGISMHSMTNGGCVLDQNGLPTNQQIVGGDRICFNFGRDLYVYAFRGVKKGTEMSKPIDKKFYKGTNPSCHDFNANAATPTGAPLLVGFTTGQIQLVSPQQGPRELRKLFNEERLIDKTKVTCLKWLPNSPHLFLASHSSGHLYLYNEELPCAATAPSYQPFKVGDGYTILTCKSKSTRNPLYKWVFSTDNCCINELCFSPCGTNLALVSQDGFLRVFHYDTMELLGIARSYFGGFLCVCWSPDGKYIVVGGEDDLVTVWSLHERRVVARGQGHRSWVSVVAFDPYTTSYTNWDGGDFSDDENQLNEYTATREERFSGDSTANGGFEGYDKNSTPLSLHTTRMHPHSASFRSDASSAALAPDKLAISYRLGSVSQDTQICLWDITEDVLRHPLTTLRQRVNSTQLNESNSGGVSGGGGVGGFMNGGIDAADGIKVIRPIAIGQVGGQFADNSGSCSPIRETTNVPMAEQHSNSSSSKFSTANCTISSQSSNANTPPDDSCDGTEPLPLTTNPTAAMAAAAPPAVASKATSRGNSNSIKFPNCISATKSDSIDSNSGQRMSNNSNSNYSTSGYNSKNSNSSTKSNTAAGSNSSNHSNSSSSFSAFNSLTQRLSNFSFLSNSDKRGYEGTSNHRQHRKAISMLKNYNQHNNHNSNSSSNHNHHHNNNRSSGSNNSSSTNFANSTALGEPPGGAIGSSATSHSFGSLKLSKSSHNSSLANAAQSSSSSCGSYDPMKLIGTPACPRFEECPLLEPLICKKIAHERLTALIFREDCFLTACQDGFIYTWARPGHTTHVAQHLSSPSQAVAPPPGGTVI